MDQDEALKTIGLCIVSVIVGLGLVYLVCRYLIPVNTSAVVAQKTEQSIARQAQPQVVEKSFPALPLNAITYPYNPEKFGQQLSGMGGYVAGLRQDYPVRVYFQVIHKTDGKEDFMKLIPAMLSGEMAKGLPRLNLELYSDSPEIGRDGAVLPVLESEETLNGISFYRVIIVGPDGKDKARGSWEYLGKQKRKITR